MMPASISEFGALAFSSLFAVINPIAEAPFFVSLTHGENSARRKKIAMRASMAACIALLIFAIAGGTIFSFFGVTVPAFRIAGGLLFVLMAIRTLHGDGEPHSAAAQAGKDPSIVPLGIPLVAGPGAISTVMVLSGQASEKTHQFALAGAIAANAAVTFLIFLGAPLIVAKIGESGQQIVTKVMGLLTAVIGVQFMINGITTVVLEMLHKAH